MGRTHTENEERVTKGAWKTEEGGRRERERPKLSCRQC